HWDTVEVGLLLAYVSDLDRLPGHGGTGNDQSRVRTEHSSGLPLCRVCLWHRTMNRSDTEGVSFAKKQIAVACLAEARRVRENNLKHGLKLAQGTADDAEHV